MTRGLRYQKPEVYEHLANQYVAGALTPRVQARVEFLRYTTPELDRAIAKVADNFADIHWHLEAKPLPAKDGGRLWEAINAQIPAPPITVITESKPLQTRFWQNLLAWKLTTGFGMAMSLTLAFMLWQQPATSINEAVLTHNLPTNKPITDSPNDALNKTVEAGPSYLATMAAHNDSDGAIQFVISAYPKGANTPSRLHVQWSQLSANKTSLAALHLWAEDRESGALTYIGLPPPPSQPWNLTKAAWQAVGNSSRLLMTRDKALPTETTLVFSGVCLQLKPWQKAQPS